MGRIKVNYPEFDANVGNDVIKVGYILHFDSDYVILVGEDQSFKRIHISDLKFVCM